MRILLAIVVAGVIVSLADWYFFGVLWHAKYLAYPEVWRRRQGESGEPRAVAISAVVGALTPVAFVALCLAVGTLRLQQTLLLAAGIWLVGPLPLWIWNYLFIKVHPLILVSGLLGWLVRLVICALVVGLLLY
jgi:hypothetical protein